MVTPALLLLALLALQGSAPVQEPPPDPDPAPSPSPEEPPVPAPAEPREAAPESPEARALWDAVVANARAAEDDHRVDSFDFQCSGRVLTGGAQTNDFKARIQYLEPGWVRRDMNRGSQIRGPEGDFLVTPEGNAVALRGREFREDTKELDRTVAVARTFVSLSDPRRIRVEGLNMTQAPRSLPKPLEKRGAELTWVLLRSPDFYLAEATPRDDGQPLPIYRVHLGIDAATKLPELAVVQRDVLGAVETAQLIQLGDYADIDGHRVPKMVRTFAPDPNTSPWRFGQRPTSTLWLEQGTLKPGLKPEAFVPQGR
jgi:hypothetical protein